MESGFYLYHTVPSDYDTSIGWNCTIGKYETECAAHALTSYLQRNGDVWRPVPLVVVPAICRVLLPIAKRRRAKFCAVREWHLAELQRVRVRRPGPPELLRCPRARMGLQVRFPNGTTRAAGFFWTDEQLRELLAQASRDCSCCK